MSDENGQSYADPPEPDAPEECADCQKLRSELVTALRDIARSLSTRGGANVAEALDFVAWRLEND